MAYHLRKTSVCKICGLPAVARYLCRKHYNNAWLSNKLTEHEKISQDDAFDIRVQKTATCWIWIGTRNRYGYGIFLLPGEVPIRAHRYIYEREIGPIPEGMILLHECDNPPCVNPAHLKPGTRRDNIHDSIQKGRFAHGERHHKNKLTRDEIIAIRHDPRSQTAIAKDYRVTPQTVGRIKSGMRHSDVT